MRLPRHAARLAPCLALCLAMLALAVPARAEERPLTFSAHPDFHPVMFIQDGVLRGVGPDLARIVLNDLGVPFTAMRGMSWGRTQHEASSGRLDLVAGLYRKPQRLADYAYVPTPFMTIPESLFVRTGGDRDVASSWDALPGRRVGVIQHERYTAAFEAYLRTHDEDVTVVSAPNLEAVLSMLVAGRIDSFPFGLYAARAKALAMGLEDAVTDLRPPLADEPFYFAFSRQSPYLDLLPEVDRRIRERIADGTVDRLLKRYLPPGAAP